MGYGKPVASLVETFMRKKIITVVAGLLLVGIGVAVWYDVPRFVIGLIKYGHQAREGTLQVGDPAPMATVYELDGTTSRDLGEWMGTRPLVLIFGSFT